MNNENNDEKKIYYKVMAGNKTFIYKTFYGSTPFYKIKMIQKSLDGKTYEFYKDVRFPKGTVIDDRTTIIINKAYENLRENPKDKYNPISWLMITDFDFVDDTKANDEAYDKFRQNLQANENNSVFDPYADFGEKIEIEQKAKEESTTSIPFAPEMTITDEDLPF